MSEETKDFLLINCVYLFGVLIGVLVHASYIEGLKTETQQVTRQCTCATLTPQNTTQSLTPEQPEVSAKEKRCPRVTNDLFFGFHC